MDSLTKSIRAKRVADRLLSRKVTDRIKTVDDVLEDNGITRKKFDIQCRGLEPDEIAYRILKLLAKSLNEGWTPDWSNGSQHKYVPYFEMRDSFGFRFDGTINWYYSEVGSRLCFKSEELARYAGQQFQHVYEQFIIIRMNFKQLKTFEDACQVENLDQ